MLAVAWAGEAAAPNQAGPRNQPDRQGEGMAPEDAVVGTVSGAVGAFLVSAAAFNWDWCYELAKTRWLTARLGRSGARLVLAALGLFLIVLGAAIMAGFRWRLF